MFSELDALVTAAEEAESNLKNSRSELMTSQSELASKQAEVEAKKSDFDARKASAVAAIQAAQTKLAEILNGVQSS